MPNPRELSQFGSFVEVDETTKNIGIATSGTPYVGIGTLIPQEKLHVVGNLRVDGGINISGIVTASELNAVSKVGIQSGGIQVGVVTTLNFIGAGNTFKYNPSTNTIDVSIQSGSAGVSVSGFGAVGNGVVDDTSSIQNALNYLASRGGGFVYLESGKTYRVSSRISVGSSCGIIGDGTPIIYATAAGFTNNTSAGKFGSTSVIIDLSGQTSSPFTTSYNQILRGFKIRSEIQQGRYICGVQARNCSNLTIENLEIYDFPLATGIRLASIRGNSKISKNYIHDFADNTTTWSFTPQSTAIELDNDRVNSISSFGVEISSNVIENIRMGSSAISSYGDQTDGINIQGANSGGNVCKNIRVVNNHIHNVGEAVDIFAHNCLICDNNITDTYNFGVKVIHGASYNVIKGNTIFNTGIAGVVIAQSNVSGVGHIKQNIVDSNIITNVDYLGVWGASQSTACVKMDANNGFANVPVDNLISNNILLPGQGEYAIINQIDCENTTLVNNKIVSAGTQGFILDQRTDSATVNIGVGVTNLSYIKTNNNLGIGSTAPISELDLRGNYTLNGTTIKNFGVVIHQRPPSGRFVFGQNSVRVSVASSTINVTTRVGIVTVNVGNTELPPLTV